MIKINIQVYRDPGGELVELWELNGKIYESVIDARRELSRLIAEAKVKRDYDHKKRLFVNNERARKVNE